MPQQYKTTKPFIMCVYMLMKPLEIVMTMLSLTYLMRFTAKTKRVIGIVESKHKSAPENDVLNLLNDWIDSISRKRETFSFDTSKVGWCVKQMVYKLNASWRSRLCTQKNHSIILRNTNNFLRIFIEDFIE